MKRLTALCAVAAMMLMAGNITQAAIYTYDLAPSDLAAKAEYNGTQPFGWDWDEDAPLGSTAAGGAPGYGNSAWFSDVQGSAAGMNGRDYTALRIFPAAAANSTQPLTVADLVEISYYSKLVSGVDWQIKIYTAPEAGDGWFRHRFNFDRAAETDQAWHQHSTDTLQVDWIAGKVGNVTSNVYPANTYLADLATSYGSEQIMWIDIIASFMTNSPASYTYLDGVNIALSNGDSIDVNLVPEPATMVLLGLGGLFCRKFKRA